jgi:1,4-alpha-glucan branching enzyme
MSGEIGQWDEWSHDESLEWHLLQYLPHQGIQNWVRDLNQFYRSEPALYELDCDPAGFEWVDCSDWENSIVSFIRRAKSTPSFVMAVYNFTPVPRHGYQVGVPRGGHWEEVLNSDAHDYGGSGHGNFGGVEAQTTPCHGRPYSLEITLPPLGATFFRSKGEPVAD